MERKTKKHPAQENKTPDQLKSSELNLSPGRKPAAAATPRPVNQAGWRGITKGHRQTDVREREKMLQKLLSQTRSSVPATRRF